MKGPDKRAKKAGYVISKSGRYCPLCGRLSSPGSFLCSRCGTSRGLRFDPHSSREVRKKPFIPPTLYCT